MKLGFRKIQPDTPVITILEDIDKYESVEDQLLDFLDGKTNINHHIVIGTSNNTEDISNSYLRPSRLDLKIEMPFPSDITRKEYLKFKGVPEEKIDKLVEKTNGFSLADLKEIYVCIYLLGYSEKDAIDKIKNPREKKNYLLNSSKSGTLGL